MLSYDTTPKDSNYSFDPILLEELSQMTSEACNPDTTELDLLSVAEVLQKMNQQDQLVPAAVATVLPLVEQVVHQVVRAFQQGGRLVYIGAGTSGRLGVLDAVECPPTFSVSAEQVIGIIAGGPKAMYKAVEGAEDDPELAAQDLINIDFNQKDVLVGLAASGRTPYVLGALAYARSLGAYTAAISCNPGTAVLTAADVGICALVGPEALTGSTRLKSGSAQKLILNMISTASMIKTGKVYQNLMVDVHASNEKLHARAVRIVMQATQCDRLCAIKALNDAEQNAKLAILMVLTGQPKSVAEQWLQQHQGNLRSAVTKGSE